MCNLDILCHTDKFRKHAWRHFRFNRRKFSWFTYQHNGLYVLLIFKYHHMLIPSFRNVLKKLHLIMVLFSTLLSTSIFWLRFMFFIFVCDTIIVYAYSLYVRYDNLMYEAHACVLWAIFIFCWHIEEMKIFSIVACWYLYSWS